MAKRKITVTVDEELVETAHTLGAESLSSVVNQALAQEVDRRARAAALGRLLADWETRLGPVDAEATAWAVAAFDDLDGVDGDRSAEPGRAPDRRPGAV